jgi:MFS family permease
MRRERLFTLPFVLCSASNLSQGLGFNLFLHLPGFLDDIGASKVMIGFLFGLASGAGILVRPAIGRRMDARGRRGVILWGCALNVAVCTAYLAVDHVGPLLVGIRIVHGLSAAMLFTSLFTLAADHRHGGRAGGLDPAARWLHGALPGSRGLRRGVLLAGPGAARSRAARPA